MGFFSSKPKAPPPPNPNLRDYTGQDIWKIICDGLEANGLKLVRGTADFGLRKWQDGKYHLTCEATPIEQSGIRIAINGVVQNTDQWNALTAEEKRHAASTSTVTLVPPEGYVPASVPAVVEGIR